MSLKKIKRIFKKKVNKKKLKKTIMISSLINEKNKKSTQEKEDIQKVQDLIIEDKFNPYKINDYSYIRKIAGILGWPVHKTFQIIEKAEIKEAIKNENISISS